VGGAEGVLCHEGDDCGQDGFARRNGVKRNDQGTSIDWRSVAINGEILRLSN
jgi:hypothetical protein